MTSLKEHYKERHPLETVELIENFFKNRGFRIVVTSILKTEINTWACHVEIFKGDIKVQHAHGKGVSKEYALASGYAELYERFCNRAVNGLGMTFMDKFTEVSNELCGYSFSPAEKNLTYEEALTEGKVIQNFCLKLFNNNHSQISAWFDAICNGQYIGMDFINLANPEDKKYFDPRILYRIINTIGLSAGNTLDEALNQGISEIFEEEIVEYFFSKNNKGDNIYEINPSCLSIDKQEKIQMAKDLGFNIKILDLSYIFGTPVVASLLINPYQANCQFNFGSFPVFDIAVERVLTELYQGVFSFKNNTLDCQIPSKEDCNIFNFGNNYTALTRLPVDSFIHSLETKNSYNTEVFIDDNISNQELLKYYISLAKKRNMNIYYCDNSLCEDMYAVSIVIPEILFKNDLAERFSSISPLIKKDAILSLARERKQLKDLQSFTPDKIDTIFNRMQVIFKEQNEFSMKDLGAFTGRLGGEDPFTPTAQIDNAFQTVFWLQNLTVFDPDRIPALINSIYFHPIKVIMSVQRYATSGLYTEQEIIDIFADLGVVVDEEFIKNCTNEKYLFIYAFVKPYYEYYYSETYKEIIQSFMKI